MFIGKKGIEDFDKCAVGDILFQDPKNKKFKYQLYNRDNRIVMKLKSRPVMPSAIVLEIEKDGLQIQSISVYDDNFDSFTTKPYTWTTTTSTKMPNYSWPGNLLNTTGTITTYPSSTNGTWWSSVAGKVTSYKK